MATFGVTCKKRGYRASSTLPFAVDRDRLTQTPAFYCVHPVGFTSPDQ